ncbi:MAG TPA: HAD hydrolase-like protein [Allosphingosinicella sp.]
MSRAGGGAALLVGDSITDADTARAAGVPFVAVSFGFSDRPVEALGADAVIDHFDELISTLQTLSRHPANAGVSWRPAEPSRPEIPAFAGMTRDMTSWRPKAPPRPARGAG